IDVDLGAVSGAVDDEFIVERDGRFSAVHPVLGENALAVLGDRERKELHKRIAEVIDTPTGRADHLDRSVDAGPDAELAEILVAAAVHARSMGALLEALDLATRAVQRTGTGDAELAGRRLLVAEIAFCHGDHETTISTLEAV